jgi:hypothetical protein
MGTIVQMFQRFKWTKCHFIYISDDSWARSLYLKFLEISEHAGITIENPENQRGIPWSAALNDLSEYQEGFKFIAQSKVVPLMLMIYGKPVQTILSGMYEAGVRKGDIVVLANDWLYPNTIPSVPEDKRQAVSDLLTGAV